MGTGRKTKQEERHMAELQSEEINAIKPDCLSGTALEQKAEAVGLTKTQMPSFLYPSHQD